MPISFRRKGDFRVTRTVFVLQEQLAKVKNELAGVRSDSEQLKSLALAGDRSQSDLEARLTAQASEIRAGQLKVQQLHEDLQQRLELYEEAKMQHADALGTIRQLDGERDKLQAELDSKAERLAELERTHMEARTRVVNVEQSSSTLEQRLVHADRHVQQLEAELQGAVQREDVAKRNLVALQQDYERLQVCKPPQHCLACASGCSCWLPGTMCAVCHVSRLRSRCRRKTRRNPRTLPSW